MKYYFITYEATSKSGLTNKWNRVIKGSPMEFITNLEKDESGYGHDRNYYNFVIINTCKITEYEYDDYKFIFE